MSTEIQIVDGPPSNITKTDSSSAPLTEFSEDQINFVAKMRKRFIEKWIDENRITDKIIELLDTTITTNSGETYKDGKTNLEAVKLLLQIMSNQKFGPTTNINFFAAPASKNGKLEY